MKKTTINNVNIDIFTQKEEKFIETKCYSGVLSKLSGRIRFEEMIRKGRRPRNPKLYDGKFISLIRKSNGKYQICSKLIELDEKTDATRLSLDVWSDITCALQFIKDYQ